MNSVVALATCAQLPELWTDDQVLLAALREMGAEVESPVWDSPRADWSAYDLVVIRSTWDYWHRRSEYLEWTRAVAAASRLCNPPDVVEWNTHKGYLRDLAAAGVPVVPTAWFTAGTRVDLSAVQAQRGWSDIVVKPAVSAGAEDTLRLADVGAVALQELADRVSPTRDVMVQPYVEAVDTTGERSLLYINGELAHAVRRPPYLSAGLFADSELTEPAADEAAVAERVLRAVPGQGPLLYARVDLVRDAEGDPMLMEVELVEPQLFFALSPGTTERMAHAVLSRAAEARAGNEGRSRTSGS